MSILFFEYVPYIYLFFIFFEILYVFNLILKGDFHIYWKFTTCWFKWLWLAVPKLVYQDFYTEQIFLLFTRFKWYFLVLCVIRSHYHFFYYVTYTKQKKIIIIGSLLCREKSLSWKQNSVTIQCNLDCQLLPKVNTTSLRTHALVVFGYGN
jgi:hypothetical protein